jgi:UDP-4-amino-4,6-dideoxy-N-acetyl-beta-L-altrosamine N-acetyltransferase
MSKTFRLVPLIDLDRPTQLQVLDIRNEEYVREWMFTGKKIGTEEHFNWIEQLRHDQSQICFVIVNNNTQPLGAVNVKKIDHIHKNAELGFYKTGSITEKGLMTKCLSTVIDYSFDALGLEKIYSEAFEGNTKSINLHTRLLFTEEGFRRSHIIKEGIRIGVHLFGLLKNEWQFGKKKIIFRNNMTIEINHV